MEGFMLPKYSYQSKRISSCDPLKAGEWNCLMDVGGPGIIKHIWITFPLKDKFFGRNNILRIFWDDEETPSVEAPIGDFFSVPMGMVGNEFQMDSYFISVMPNNGMNCFFPMPFAKSARVELFVNMLDMGHGFYFQADYEKYREKLPEEWNEYRFNAQFRMDSNTESYGHRYIGLETEGSGFYIGSSFGIRRHKKQKDAWYHGGGDLMYIDGEANPHIIHGIGAEDYFGQSWGTGTSSTLYMGNPYLQTLTTDDTRPFMNSVLYRFHVTDPVRFNTSFVFMLGAMGDSISNVSYWYQKNPALKSFRIPLDANLQQDSSPLENNHHQTIGEMHRWNVYGPISDEEEYAFDDKHPAEDDTDLTHTSIYKIPLKEQLMNVRWRKLVAPRGFLDLNIRMRPEITGIRYQTECFGLAHGYIRVDKGLDVYLRVGFDDRLAVKINKREIFDEHHFNGFDHVKIPVHLEEGSNLIQVKSSNTHNNNFKSWVTNIQIVHGNGELVKNLKITDVV